MYPKILQRISITITVIFALLATYISYTSQNILAYNDATAHLNTARRVVDNLTPGIVQLGSVWLPLLHILEMPFTANFFLWQSGLAGAIVSGLSFIIASFFLFKLTLYITNKPLAAFLSVLVLITNPNLLYIQSTAMFEPLLIATEFGVVYYLTRWAKERKVNDLILAAFFTMLTTVTRYDGWALFIAGSVLVLFVNLFSKIKGREGLPIIYATLAGFGIAMWLFYNLIVFGDALYFARSEFSAAAQQEILQSRGALLTKHNLPLSILTYSLSTIFNNGLIMLSVAGLGLFIYLVYLTKRICYLGPLLLLVPYFFNIISLYLGQSVIWMPMLPPHYETYFNIRYGLLLLPAVAFFSGYFASKHFLLYFVVFIAIIGQSILFLNPGLLPIMGYKIGIITLGDTVSSVNNQTRKASNFLHANYDYGLIMVSSASSDAFIFRSGIPLKNYITEGTGEYWKTSIRNPTKYSRWLVFFRDRTDRVGKTMPTDTTLSQYYNLVYEDQTYKIWKKL